MVSYANILLVEYQVLSEFLHDYSLATDCFKPGVSPLVLTDHFFSIWLSFEVLLATTRHARSDLEICFMDSTTAFFGTYDWLVGFHRKQCIIRDPESLANHTVNSVSESLHLVRITKRIGLDEHEIAALMQLLFAHYEKELFRDSKAHQSFVDRSLKELHAHYKSTYFEYHDRLAVLMSIMGEFHTNLTRSDEYITLVELYSTASLDNFDLFDQFIRYSNSINGIWRFGPAKAALALGNVHALRRSVTL
ncbi:hypothetical protein AAVH_23497 [Aphelenchoides avenae]|nr:hypothetical protein AAVH_23497 [Aphelenchus avenae]